MLLDKRDAGADDGALPPATVNPPEPAPSTIRLYRSISWLPPSGAVDAHCRAG
jgi:hypothetical protein